MKGLDPQLGQRDVLRRAQRGDRREKAQQARAVSAIAGSESAVSR
jgi:hypothetical protein